MPSPRVALAMALLPLLLTACGSSSPAATPATPTTLAAPVLANLADQTLTVDVALPAALVFANTGGGALLANDATPTAGCAASANLPTGLAVTRTTNTNSCQITGTPATITTAPVTVTVTATNATGSDTADVALTVAAATTTGPTLTLPTAAAEQTADITATTATINFTVSQAGTLYAVAVAGSTPVLTAETTVTMAKAGGTGTLMQAVTASSTTAALTGLSASTAYTVYMVLEDDAATPMQSALETITFTTTATTVAIPAPLITAVTVTPASTTATVVITADRPGRACAAALPPTLSTPSALAIKGSTSAGPGACANLTANLPTTVTVAGLSATTMYVAYAVVTGLGENGRDSEVESSASFTTTAPQPTVPTVTVSTTAAEQTADITHTSATINYTVNQAGTLYAVAVAGSTPILTPETTVTMAKTGGAGTLMETVTTSSTTAALTGLSASTAYTVYMVLENDATTPVQSALETITFTTAAIPAPVIASAVATTSTELVAVTATATAQVTITADRDGRACADAVLSTVNAPTP
ncbi:MAG: hypothetical protein K8963_11305, partial [Proteobacteria bacterium]|nr:hypothetical protein [Pseudomonadota bacterium]